MFDFKVEYISDQVNKLDKDMGVKLKQGKKKKNRNTKKDYERIAVLLKAQIYLDVITLNDLPRHVFITNDNRVKIKNTLDTNTLTEYSKYFVNSIRGESINDPIFRLQFSSLLMLTVANNLTKIVDGMVHLNKGKLNEYDKRILHIHTVYKLLCDTVKCLLDMKYYQDNLMELYKLLSTRRIRKDEYLSKKTFKDVNYIKQNINYITDFDEDVRGNELLHFSYIITTNQRISNRPINNTSNLDDTKKMRKHIRKLGKYIINNWDDNGSRPIMVDIFMKCAPLTYYKFKDINDDGKLNYGCKALLFAMFMLGKVSVNDVEKMIS